METSRSRVATWTRPVHASAMAFALLSTFASVTTRAAAQQEPLHVREVRYEQPPFTQLPPGGGPRGVWVPGPLRFTEYEYKDGIYKSVLNGIRVAVPRIRNERSVAVREGVVLRSDGSLSRTLLIFDVGGSRAPIEGELEGVSAVVIDRLDSRSGDTRESLLDRLHGGPEERARSTQNNFAAYSKVETVFGPALQMVMRNRANTQVHFPGQVMGGGPFDGTTENYGVSRFIAVATGTLVQFSQIFPCQGLSDADCKVAALQSLDAFIGGVIEFPLLPLKRGAAVN